MFLILLIASLVIGGIVLMFFHDQGTILGVANDDFAQIIVLGTLTAAIGSSVLWRYRGRMGEGLKAVGIWVLIALALVAIYAYRFEIKNVGLNIMAAIVPGMVVQTDPNSITIHRSENNHFILNGRVNGQSIRLLLDTGASLIVLTVDDAETVGINTENLIYSTPVNTANGRTSAAPVILRRVAIGAIAVDHVRAMVAQPGSLNESLLGMSFLNRLPSWQVERDRLILRQ